MASYINLSDTLLVCEPSYLSYHPCMGLVWFHNTLDAADREFLNDPRNVETHIVDKHVR